MDEKKYTMDDVETLRAKSGLSYEEVVGLLEKYDGDVTRALIELEKRGVVGDGSIHIRVNAERLKDWWRKLCALRVVIDRKEEKLVDLPLLYMLLALLLGWRLVLISAVLALVFGCRARLTGLEKAEDKADNKTEQKSAETPDAPQEAKPSAEATPAFEAAQATETATAAQRDDGFKSITIE